MRMEIMFALEKLKGKVGHYESEDLLVLSIFSQLNIENSLYKNYNSPSVLGRFFLDLKELLIVGKEVELKNSRISII